MLLTYLRIISSSNTYFHTNVILIAFGSSINQLDGARSDLSTFPVLL